VKTTRHYWSKMSARITSYWSGMYALNMAPGSVRFAVPGVGPSPVQIQILTTMEPFRHSAETLERGTCPTLPQFMQEPKCQTESIFIYEHRVWISVKWILGSTNLHHPRRL